LLSAPYGRGHDNFQKISITLDCRKATENSSVFGKYAENVNIFDVADHIMPYRVMHKNVRDFDKQNTGQ